MVKLRLRRIGRKKLPLYKIVAADSRAARDGRFIEALGNYDPGNNPPKLDVKEDRVFYWLKSGAQPTDTVKNLLSSRGIMLRHHLMKKGADEAKINEEMAKWSALQEGKMQKAAERRLKKKTGKKKKTEAGKSEQKPEAKTDDKAEVKEEKKPEAKTEEKAEVKAEVKVEVKEEPKAEEKKEAKGEAKSKEKTEPKAEAKDEQESKPEEKKEEKTEKPADSGEGA